jgi:hypothetical protein
MYARRMSPGRYVPASRSACSLGSTVGHCSSSASIVCPSGPGGALVRRHRYQRIRQSIRDLLHRRRRCTLGIDNRLRRSRPDLPKPVPGSPAGGPFRVFCCCDRQAELHRRSSTGTAFRCPPVLDPTRSAGITRLPVLLGPRTSAGPSVVLLSFSELPALAGTQQTSGGETLRFRRDRVATTTPSASTGIGHRHCGSARPPRNALRRFTFVRHHGERRTYGLFQTRPHGNPPTRRAAREPPGRFRAAPLSLRMLDSPCQGSRTGFTPPISMSVLGTPTAPCPTGSASRRPARYSTTGRGWLRKSLDLGGCCDHRENPGVVNIRLIVPVEVRIRSFKEQSVMEHASAGSDHARHHDCRVLEQPHGACVVRIWC